MLRKPPTVQPVVYGPPPVLIDTIRIEPPKPEPTPVVYGPPVVNYEEKKAAE